jgi:c-di-GMP phosphodiesterase
LIKVDMRRTPFDRVAAMVKRYRPWRSRLLAEKVETREEFLAAKKAGFVYFQGILSQARVDAAREGPPPTA